MKNLTPLWPPKWWYVGPIARRKEDILLAGTIALFFIVPFTCGGSRQARIAATDRRIRTLLSVNQLGKPATELETVLIQRARSFSITKKEGKPDLYVFMTPSTALRPFCETYSGPSFTGYNVHILPLPPGGTDTSPREKAMALGLFEKSGAIRNELDLRITLSLTGRSVKPDRVNKAWDNLNKEEIKTVHAAWTDNKQIFESNSGYPIIARVGDHAYKLKNSTVPSIILKHLTELAK